MINLRLNLRDHQEQRCPFDVPVLVVQPSISETNVVMVFGNQPQVYTAKTSGNKPMSYDDPLFATKAYIHCSTHDDVVPAAEWLNLAILWCPRTDTNVQPLLAHFKIKDDEPEADDIPDDDGGRIDDDRDANAMRFGGLRDWED